MTPTSQAVPAGIQVVSLLAIHGSHETVVHPQGTVGVITRAPVGTEVNYTVHSPDGFEAALTIDQFEILKHFKDRLDDPSGTSAFDLNSLVIFSCITGSRHYGLDTDESDVDRRGVYLAPANLQ